MRIAFPRALRSVATLVALPLALAVSTHASQTDTPSNGYSLESLPYPGTSATATLTNGDIVSFDGVQVSLHAPDGLLTSTLTTLPAFVFPSFLLVDPTESFLVFGESSVGVIYRMPLAPSVESALVTLPLNYSAAFEDAGHLVVSAATAGFGQGNELYRVDLTTGEAVLLAAVAGPSGPVAVGNVGELYYGTQTDVWPPPPGSSSLLRWNAVQLSGAPVLSELDATLVTTPFDGSGSLAFDPVHGDLYLAENNFGTGANRIQRIRGGVSTVVVDGVRDGRAMGNLEVIPGDGVATFAPYQPSASGRVLYNTTDFVTLFERNAIGTQRPVLTLAGAGTVGAGPFEVSVREAAPSGFGLLFYDLTLRVPATEFVLGTGGTPLFLGLSLAGAQRAPATIPVDAVGAGTVSYLNPGGLEGLFSLQLLLFDDQGKLVGTTSAADL